VAAIPRNHGPNVTCRAALRATGVGPSVVVDGARDGTLVAQWVEAHLIPTLHPGQIVILDKLRLHTHAGARYAIAAAGWHLRCLPAYSPDVNPIALVCSRLTAHLRTTGARALDARMDAIGVGRTAVSADDALAHPPRGVSVAVVTIPGFAPRSRTASPSSRASPTSC